MKTKFFFALAALLMLGSASLKAQESNNSSTTYQEGDLNHDGKVDVGDITYLVNLIMSNKKTDYSEQPFTIVPVNSDLTVRFYPHTIRTSNGDYIHYAFSMKYSKDGGQTWTPYRGDWGLTVTVNSDEKLMIEVSANGLGRFESFSVSGGSFNVEGNIMSLVTEEDFASETIIWPSGFKSFFSGFTNLISAENLVMPTDLAESCYANMFEGCTSLIKAPVLPATTLAKECYASMFSGCTSLNYVKCSATDISAQDCTSDWLKDVSPTGTFIKASTMNDWPTGASGIPTGWTVESVK